MIMILYSIVKCLLIQGRCFEWRRACLCCNCNQEKERPPFAKYSTKVRQIPITIFVTLFFLKEIEPDNISFG